MYVLGDVLASGPACVTIMRPKRTAFQNTEGKSGEWGTWEQGYSGAKVPHLSGRWPERMSRAVKKTVFIAVKSKNS